MNSIGVDFKLKTIQANNKKLKLQIWDTAGQERFRSITTSYYKGAQVIIIVYDVSDADSFNHINNWLLEIEKFAKEGVMKVLVGNKCDITNRVISFDEGSEYAKKNNMEYYETSAKEDSNIEGMFVNVSSNYLSKLDFGSGKKSSGFTSDKAVSISNSLGNGFTHVSNGKSMTIKKKKFVCC